MTKGRRALPRHLWVAASALAFVWLCAASGCARVTKEQREAAYQSALTSYADILTIGMSRKDAEATLKARGTSFHQTCCMGAWKNAWDDLIKIGEEGHPWYCSEHNVYVGLEFTSTGTHEFPEAHDSDTLQRVRIFHRLEGCL